MKKLYKIAGALVLAAFLCYENHAANRAYCEHFVKELMYNCKDLSDLSDYINYNMLSKDLKKQIRKSDFKILNDIEIYEFCKKTMDLNYEYSGDLHRTSTTYKYIENDLAKTITVDGTPYTVSVDLRCKPGFFFNPKIVDLDTYVAVKKPDGSTGMT